ncbi:MAG: helicase-associated domain-containing protein [Planctomycetota bacterium]
MISVHAFLSDRRKAELQTIHQFWYPGESRLTERVDLERRIADALAGGVNAADCVARLNRSQRALLQAVLVAPDHVVECEVAHRLLESEGVSSLEVENAGRMLGERGFLGRERLVSPRREFYRIPAELADNLVKIFELDARKVQAADQLSQKRLAFEVDFDGPSLDARISQIEDVTLRRLACLAVEFHGLVDASTPGVAELLSDTAGDRGGDEALAPDRSETSTQWGRSRAGRAKAGGFDRSGSARLEELGIGTIGSISLKDFGIVVEEPALIIFQEWILRRAQGQLREPVRPDTTIESGVDLYIDLDRFVGLLEAEPLALTRDGKIPRRVLETLRSTLFIQRQAGHLEGDPVESIALLAQRLGIVERYAGLLQQHPERLRVWRKLDLTRKVDMMMDQFLAENRGTRWSFHQGPLRRILLGVLKEQLHDEWIALDAVVGTVVSTYLLELEEREVRESLRQRREEDFSRERLSSPFYRLGRDLVYWIVNRLLVLGVCELGSIEGRLSAIRLSALGKEVLGVERLPRESRILVNPDGEIMLFCEGLRGMRMELQLSRFAERVSAERIRRYKIHRESLRAGVRSGLSLAEVREMLQEAAQHPVPEPVLVSIRDWGKDLDWVTIQPALCLTGLRPDRAAELGTLLTVAGCEHALLADGGVVIHQSALESGDWDRTLTKLRESGWLMRGEGVKTRAEPGRSYEALDAGTDEE